MPTKHAQRFRIVHFTNPATGTSSFRVTGLDRAGKRVRENFADQRAAQARQIELEADFLGRASEETLRLTKLTQPQVRLAEVAFLRVDADADVLAAVDFWLSKGRPRKGKGDVRLDAAVEEFERWLDSTDEIRERTKANLRNRVKVFGSELGDVFLGTITPDAIRGFLDGRRVSARSRKNDHLAISRFLAWAGEPPRRWLV